MNAHATDSRGTILLELTPRYRLANFLGNQLGWWACVLGAVAGRPALGAAVMGALVLVHLGTVTRLRGEISLLVIGGLLGYVVDSTLVLAGAMSFPAGAQLGGPSPVWMVALWVGFAATLRSSLHWLSGRWLLAIPLGAAAGPLAYLGGQGLGVIQVTDGPLGALAIGLGWAVALPLLVWWAGCPEAPGTRDAPRIRK